MKKETIKINIQPSHVQAYRFIEKYIAKNVSAPEVIEIASAIKVTSRHAYRLVDELILLGYLSKEDHKKRSIKVLKPLQ